MIQITARRMVGGTRHEHIAAVRWTNLADGKPGEGSRQAVVAWLLQPDTRAIVVAGTTSVDVGVVEATPPYLRTHADGKWSDNLLALPTF